MDCSLNYEKMLFSELSINEQIIVDGGINWDNLVGGVVTVVCIGAAIADAPAVATGAVLFGAAYYITRGIIG